MTVVHWGAEGGHWDEVMRQLARWLIRHLDDPVLLLWLVKHGSQLHDDLALWIQHRLDALEKLESAGDIVELTNIRKGAPNAIPGALMRTLWGLVLKRRVKSRMRDLDIYSWCARFKRYGLTTTLRLELRDMLTPCITLSEPFRWPAVGGERREPERIKDLVDWEIVLSVDEAHSGLRDLLKDERWIAVLPELLLDFSILLRDAFDLMRELGGAVDESDLSYIHHPSISEHP
jgi:hypothetical protein